MGLVACQQCHCQHGPVANGRTLPIYQTSISSSSSTPTFSVTRSRTRSMSRSTSWLLAPCSATMKFACWLLTSAPPNARPLQAGLLDQHAVLMPRGFLKYSRRFRWLSGWLAFLTIHCFCMRLVNSTGSSGSSVELGPQDDQLVETALAIGKDQLVALALDELACSCQHGGPIGPLPDVASPSASIAARTPQRPGNADQGFEARQTIANRSRDDLSQLGPRPRDNPIIAGFDLAENGRGQVNDHARHALGPDQDVRAAAEQADRQVFVAAAGHQRHHSSRWRGSAKFSAGPPRLNQVCGASGSWCRTNSSKPFNNPMTDTFDGTRTHGQHDIVRSGRRDGQSDRNLGRIGCQGRRAQRADSFGQGRRGDFSPPSGRFAGANTGATITLSALCRLSANSSRSLASREA